MTPIEELPSIVLLRICEFLDRDHTSSLVAFACASKSCCSIAIILLLQTIRLSNHNELSVKAQKLQDTLQRNAATRYVHRLIINGHWPRDRNGISHQHSLRLSAEDRGYECRLIDGLPWFHNPADDTPPADVYASNDSWMSVAALVKQLPALQDLTYRCLGQFPPCLLETLHQYLPHCRLHIDPFKLRSLNDPSTDPYEIVLATSPNLYSIGVDCDMQYGSITGEFQNFNYEAAQSMVAGLAPNLREIRVFHAGYGATLFAFPDGVPWKGFTPNRESRKSSSDIGALGSLWIRVGDILISKQLIDTWNAHTDFSILQSLNLESEVDHETLEYLAASSSFPSLRKLALTLTDDRMDQTQRIEFYNIASQFLLSLPPLSRLTLVGALSRLNIESILEHRGVALLSLDLRSPPGDKRLSSQEIAKIGAQCSLLEDLRLSIRRFKGDITEVSTYRALGSLPRLKYLHLTLNASNNAILGEESLAGFDEEDDDAEYPETANDPSFDDFDQRFLQGEYWTYRSPRNGHIRDAFISSAVDKQLAESIFWEISSGKPTGSSLLEELQLNISEGGEFGGGRRPDSVSAVVVALARCWRCRRSQRDDRRHEVTTMEMAKWEQWTGEWTGDVDLPPAVKEIFRRIWPGKGDWRVEWHSFPLQGLDN